MQIDRLNISIDLGFTVYRFGKDLPCVSVVSGLTKSDGCCIAILRKVVEELKDKTVRGTAVIVPQLIEQLHIFKTSRCRAFADLLSKLIEKFAEVVPRDCLIIELRCLKGVTPHMIVPEDHVDERLKLLAEAAPLEYIVRSTLRGFSRIINDKGYTVGTLVIKGGREFEPSDVDQGVGIVLDMLTNLGLLKRRSRRVQHVYLGRYHVIRCLLTGIFSPTVASGSEVSAKTVIGRVDGNEIESPVDGVVLYISSSRLCCIDDVVCIIASKSVQ